jgi:hypothetical protein
MDYAKTVIENTLKVIKEKQGDPSKPLVISKGMLPDNCVKALMIYCAHKDINYQTPFGFKRITSTSREAERYRDEFCDKTDFSNLSNISKEQEETLLKETQSTFKIS